MTHAALVIDGAQVASPAMDMPMERHDAHVFIDSAIYAIAVWYDSGISEIPGHWSGYVHVPRGLYVPQIMTIAGRDVTYVGNGSNRIQWQVYHHGHAIPMQIERDSKVGDFWIGFDLAGESHQPTTAVFIEHMLMPFARAAHEVFAS